jgi:hypothetical protein
MIGQQEWCTFISLIHRLSSWRIDADHRRMKECDQNQEKLLRTSKQVRTRKRFRIKSIASSDSPGCMRSVLVQCSGENCLPVIMLRSGRFDLEAPPLYLIGCLSQGMSNLRVSFCCESGHCVLSISRENNADDRLDSLACETDRSRIRETPPLSCHS